MSKFKQIGSIHGFTLVELLVYIALTGIVLTGIYSLLISNSKAYTSQENSMAMNQDLRAAMDMMVREIRMAGYDPTRAGGMGFIGGGPANDVSDSDSIRFTLDLNDDGASTGSNEDINYYLYTTSGVQKIGRKSTSAGSPQPIAETITALGFVYRDANDGVLTPPLDAAAAAAIRTVQISITAQTPNLDPILGYRKTRTYNSRVRIRNAGL